MSAVVLKVAVRHEHDIVVARQRARQVAEALGLDQTDQARVATAVSEVTRNALMYARGGTVEFAIEGRLPPQLLLIAVTDHGPGIANLDSVLSGQYRSTTGLGVGLAGARRLMDQFEVTTAPGQGTTVVLKKLLPRGRAPLSAADVADLATRLTSRRPRGPIEELQHQNQELLMALDALHARQAELVQLNRELEDTNRGVVALYAELDERADHLRRADELKSRFLSNMTHEFRTPVNAILALSRLLLDAPPHGAPPLPEVHHILAAAEQLSEIVNDLLDLAKAEAGKIVVRASRFDVSNLFGALRGMLRPLLVNQSVALAFEDPSGLPPLDTDESKVSQILRNFISNALKYTERGEVRVSARYDGSREMMIFSVADTGIGIAPDDQARIFEEFVQVEHRLQRRVKGTGLGLPLSKRLAELLNGSITVASTPGVGSTFEFAVPVVYRGAAAGTGPAQPAISPHLRPLLIVEDSLEDRLLYERVLAGTVFQPLLARTIREAEAWLGRVQPVAIVLDIRLFGEDVWEWLARFKADPATRAVPMLVISSLDDPRKALALGADAFARKPLDPEWLLRQLTTLTRSPLDPAQVLVIDDDAVSHFIVEQVLSTSEYVVTHATTARDGLAQATASRPDVILLDLMLPDRSGAEVLTDLKANPATRDLPVIVVTSKVLEQAEERQLARAAAVLSKGSIRRETLATAIADARMASR